MNRKSIEPDIKHQLLILEQVGELVANKIVFSALNKEVAYSHLIMKYKPNKDTWTCYAIHKKTGKHYKYTSSIHFILLLAEISKENLRDLEYMTRINSLIDFYKAGGFYTKKFDLASLYAIIF